LFDAFLNETKESGRKKTSLRSANRDINTFPERLFDVIPKRKNKYCVPQATTLLEMFPLRVNKIRSYQRN